MILAVIDDFDESDDSVRAGEKAARLIDEIQAVEIMTLPETFDKLSILSLEEPQVKPDIILISFKKVQRAFELVLALKSDEKYTDTPVLCFDARDREDIIRAVQEAGCMDYILNIDDTTEAYSRIKAAMRLRQEISKRLTLEQEIEEHTAKIEKISNIDALTGLLSKSYFEHKAAEEISRAVRSKYYVSIIKLDVIDFKGFNKKYGFLEGDKVLRRIATALKKSVERPGDLLARAGGDSFALFLPTTDLKVAEAIGMEALKNIKALAVAYESLSVHICGLSLIPSPADNAEELLELVGNIISSCGSGATDGDNFFCVKS